VTTGDSERPSITRVTEVPSVLIKQRGSGTACIIVIYGPELGKRMQLGGSSFEVGRGSKNDLCLDQESISRNHARITFDGADHWVADLKSTNGTFVNDVQITERRLSDGDQVRIGRSILKFMTGENVEVQYHEEIYRLMTVDALTQVFNRRYFNEALEREYNRSRRYGRALCLIVFDIDHFKRVNDTHGHLTGDNLLRQISMAVKPRLRRDDVFARTGGEEFGVLLPEVALDGARTTADKIRRIIEASPLQYEQQVIACTVSLGVASLIADDPSGEELYRRADVRLYEAKQAGRNRVAG
jgi:diguanylate cyclase (GGDEF)-like protein